MRVAVECKSPLLQKSLEIFLQKHLSSLKNCDIVVRDIKMPNDERNFYISSAKDADLMKPFSKAQLILALEKRCGVLHGTQETPFTKLHLAYEEDDEEHLDFAILQKRIEVLTKEYQDNILRAVRAFYEK
ncbi:MAG: hypothetical protein PHX44_10205 [Sulfurimonas sp.]|uniref:hypothetical protein n=1 Tax=Sulfurimonas sp. TaxID=2022749 RepID=UPI002601609E|nr:hypothetical protein [Sulfurimonas sp.]MDD2653406.1 hypothetical protein [Sulfurimonas sp.]MDD3452604.1 hypothetical protein [Sulfurimonas sp.]